MSSSVAPGAVLKELAYPLYGVHIDDLLSMRSIDDFKAHQTLVKQGKCKLWTPDMGDIMFISHQWTGNSHPDPTFAQFEVLVSAMQSLKAGKVDVYSDPHMVMIGGELVTKAKQWKKELKNVYIWADWFCIPQLGVHGERTEDEATARQNQIKAVSCISHYVQFCSRFMVLAPDVEHNDRKGEICDASSWASRGWCRLEVVLSELNIASEMRPHVLIKGGANDRNRQDIMHFSRFDMIPCPVGDGGWTSIGDRALVAPVLLQSIAKKTEWLKQQGKSKQFKFRWQHAMRRYMLRGIPLDDYGGKEKALGIASNWAEFQKQYGFKGPLDNCRGYTPLRYAVLEDNLAVARELLQVHGADPCTPSRATKGQTREIAVFGGESILGTAMQVADSGDMLKLLIAHGADPKQRSADTMNSILCESALWDNVVTARWCLENMEGHTGTSDQRAAAFMMAGPFAYHTPALTAAIFGKARVLDYFRECGDLPFNGIEFIGHAALHAAVTWGHLQTVKVLLQSPTACEHLNEICKAPRSMVGCKNGKVKRRGNSFGRFLVGLHRLKYRFGPRSPIVRFLAIAVGATPLFCAIEASKPKVVAMLLEADADPIIRCHGMTPLQFAELKGNQKIVDMIRQATKQ
eukprot:g2279.t1